MNSGVSGRQTLGILATAAGIGRPTVDAVLERVGLADRADDLARGYSLGMRQRLGLAIALLKDPEVLILDEPANGLDPAGIREIRELVRSLGAEGRTVFLSSHLLGEVEQVCDQVAILSRGRTVASGPINEVLAAARPSAIWVKVTDLAGGSRTLAAAGLGAQVDGEHIRVDVSPEQGEAVTRVLVADGHYPSELRPVETSLEDAFFALTDAGGRVDDPIAAGRAAPHRCPPAGSRDDIARCHCHRVRWNPRVHQDQFVVRGEVSAAGPRCRSSAAYARRSRARLPPNPWGSPASATRTRKRSRGNASPTRRSAPRTRASIALD